MPTLVFCLMGGILTPAAPASASAAGSEGSFVAKSLDATLIRPLGAVRLAAGSLALLPVTFFNALGQSSVAALNSVGLASDPNWGIFGESFDLLVRAPSRFLFVRALGEDLYGEN